MRWLIVVGALVACKYDPNRVGGDSGVPDGATDSTSDTPLVDGQVCFTGVTTACLQVVPDAPFEPPASILIDTDTDPLCVATTPDTGACVVAGTSVAINLGIAVRGIGTKPLILVATSGTLTIAGRIDVANHRGDATDGAGSQPTSCTPPTASGDQAGGPGGSFVGRGGTGGNAGGSQGAASVLERAFTTLEGGCRGGPGGGGTGETPGRGGGAVELVASSITISGTINASGEGGTGGAMPDGGAGGGGSGGGIVLASPNLEIQSTARIAANGGGGGEGAATALGRGDDGDDVSPATPLSPASGGSGTGGNSGDGGEGFAGGAAPEDGAAGNGGSDGGGGGGGGGAGIVKAPIAPITNAGQVSPTLVN